GRARQHAHPDRPPGRRRYTGGGTRARRGAGPAAGQLAQGRQEGQEEQAQAAQEQAPVAVARARGHCGRRGHARPPGASGRPARCCGRPV
ncbi:hypothetical protein H4R19_002786, partial [Coemansia spiralis]